MHFQPHAWNLLLEWYSTTKGIDFEKAYSLGERKGGGLISRYLQVQDNRLKGDCSGDRSDGAPWNCQIDLDTFHRYLIRSVISVLIVALKFFWQKINILCFTSESLQHRLSFRMREISSAWFRIRFTTYIYFHIELQITNNILY